MAVTSDWWEHWYRAGNDSGGGSRGEAAEWKAAVVNKALADHQIESVIEFGCGDGYQLSLVTVPKYMGFDTSPTAVRLCQERFADDPTKTFALLDEWDGETADAALSLDVVYHLLDDDDFARHMESLFTTAERLVVIYSTNYDGPEVGTVRHRRFTDWTDEHAASWDYTHTPSVLGDAEFYMYTQ